ncbi:MAG: TM0996/MTH895 family glutaredoxin-like protein [Lewinella sp.]|nr:TM0996/MTH895 family glutaredoxin-like protein [Lewinella sp.]
MKTIKILGTGCPNCVRTTEVVKQAVAELALTDVAIEKVEDIMQIMQYNILSTPAVVIDEVVEIKGRVPSKAEVMELLNR